MPVTQYAYHPGAGVSTIEHATAEVTRSTLAEPNSVTWILADGHDDVTDVILRDVLQLHPLTVEDIVGDLPHPKVEEFGQYLYIIAHGIDQAVGTPDSLQTTELDIVLGERFVAGTSLALWLRIRACAHGNCRMLHAAVFQT